MAKVVLHVHHHQRTAREVDLNGLRQSIKSHRIGATRLTHQTEALFAELPGVVHVRAKQGGAQLGAGLGGYGLHALVYAEPVP